MKAHFKSSNGRLLVEVEGKTVKELFTQIAEVQEILDADEKCGKCGSQLIKFRVRAGGKFTYYELHCEACGAALGFGQRQEGGGLFPKRRNEHGLLPNRGWMLYVVSSKKDQ